MENNATNINEQINDLIVFSYDDELLDHYIENLQDKILGGVAGKEVHWVQIRIPIVFKINDIKN